MLLDLLRLIAFILLTVGYFLGALSLQRKPKDKDSSSIEDK